MKHLFLAIIFLIIGQFTFSQKIKIEEPQSIGYVVYVNDTVGNGLSLEKQIAEIKYEKKNLTYTTIAIVNDGSSLVRIDSLPELKFICRVSKNKGNPDKQFQILEFNNVGGKRVGSYILKGTLLGTYSQKNKPGEYTVDKYGKSSYLITLFNFKPGEYGISTSSSNDVYLFGIDK